VYLIDRQRVMDEKMPSVRWKSLINSLDVENTTVDSSRDGPGFNKSS
jgi:hypothetical protein